MSLCFTLSLELSYSFVNPIMITVTSTLISFARCHFIISFLIIYDSFTLLFQAQDLLVPQICFDTPPTDFEKFLDHTLVGFYF